MHSYPFRSRSRRRKSYFVEPGFSIISAIKNTAGRVIEFAGPSCDGYYFLNSVPLPRGLEITNLREDGYFAYTEKQELAKKLVTSTVDIRCMSFANSSVGVALFSYLSIYDDETIDTSMEATATAAQNELSALTARSSYSTPKYALRGTLLRKSLDFLESGGLVVIEGLTKIELKYAQMLGFKLRMLNGTYTYDDSHQSVVLQKA